MNLHTHSQKKVNHLRSHNGEHSPVGEDSGRLMRILGRVAHEGKALSDYRRPRIIPASNRVIVGTILVLLAGAVLAHLLPANLRSVAWVVVIAAAGHLALLVIDGLMVICLFSMSPPR